MSRIDYILVLFSGKLVLQRVPNNFPGFSDHRRAVHVLPRLRVSDDLHEKVRVHGGYPDAPGNFCSKLSLTFNSDFLAGE